MGELKAGISKDGQPCEHALSPSTLSTLSQDSHFRVIIKWTSTFIKKVGYNPKSVPFIPISSWHCDNMLEESTNMPWYKGWTKEMKAGVIKGKTLLDTIDAIEPPVCLSHKPLCLPLQDVHKIGGIGTIPSSPLRCIMSSLLSVSVSFNVKNMSVKDICWGNIASDSKNDPAKGAASFNTQVIVLNHPNQICTTHPTYKNEPVCHILLLLLSLTISSQTTQAIITSPLFHT
ncbi:hypothetical protein DACRYDRAFT_91848 [Dacryopinax primogenitus]|uniref:Uncharacterized protein n=1 Tax=Dacryopinax primogenitus (strain DJM 731) TaxID=1858805 RepID=M5FQB3_DACPD|nr:uncharacterized protein DACRYDRAFT_91848 [Dacryopinax primogenitus]EJT96864.1 hypothetical protein DACRYDRAFT_91848 [Dacryopinax primogenitus]